MEITEGQKSPINDGNYRGMEIINKCQLPNEECQLSNETEIINK
jgi:hypothetical protein